MLSTVKDWEQAHISKLQHCERILVFQYNSSTTVVPNFFLFSDPNMLMYFKNDERWIVIFSLYRFQTHLASSFTTVNPNEAFKSLFSVPSPGMGITAVKHTLRYTQSETVFQAFPYVTHAWCRRSVSHEVFASVIGPVVLWNSNIFMGRWGFNA